MNNFEILNYFQRKAQETSALFQVEIDVTKRCNANCLFCFQGSQHHYDDKLSFNEIVNLLDDLRELGVYSIGFSGGEPFIRDDFIKILEEAKKRHFRVSFITNGMLLNKEIIKQLKDLNIDRVTCSFHSIDKETYNLLFGISNNLMFDKTIENIKTMLEEDISVGIAVTVTKYNVNQIQDIQDYFISLGMRKSDINFNLLLKGDSQINRLLPDPKDILKFNEIIQYKEEQYYNSCNKQRLCQAGIITCCIDYKGDVYPCTFFNSSAGNIRDQSIKEIWNNSHLFKMIRSIDESFFRKCNNCSMNDKCGVCIATNLNETGNMFIPSEEYCASRKAKYEKICNK